MKVLNHVYVMCICNVNSGVGSPADYESGAKRCSVFFKITDIEVWQCVVYEAMHGSIHTVHVLINQSWDEVWCKGDDKSL